MVKSVTFFAPGIRRYETEELCQLHPDKLRPISVTGPDCPLNCDHCRGVILRSMRSLRPGETLFEVAEALKARGAEALLVSGGSDLSGRVPLHGHLEDLARIKAELGLRVLVHTGLADERVARGLAEARVDGALIDIIGHAETIRRVYHLKVGPEAFEAALARLVEAGVRTLPHICIGLHFGKLLGEEKALEIVARYPVAGLVVIVLMPLGGTPMAEVTPPSLEEVGRIFRLAKEAMGSTPVLLGCARPFGPTKEAIDRLALDAGLDAIAYPAEGLVGEAARRGLAHDFQETCCAFYASGGKA